MKEEASAALKDRLQSPFIGSFLLALGFVYWKAIVIVTSGLALDIKLQRVQDEISNTTRICTALVIAVVYSVIAKPLNGLVEILHELYEKYISDFRFSIRTTRKDSIENMVKADKVTRASRFITMFVAVHQNYPLINEVVILVKRKDVLMDLAEALERRDRGCEGVPSRLYENLLKFAEHEDYKALLLEKVY